MIPIAWLTAACVSCLALAVTAFPARAADVDVYILAGQSNAGGHGYVSKEFAYFSDLKDPGLVEIGETKWLAEQPNTWLFAQGGAVPSKDHPTFWERRSNGWVAMKAGFDATDRAGKVIRNNPFGVEVTFASRMAELRPGRAIAVVKYTRGATSVRTDWDPKAGRAFDVDRPTPPGHCYAGLRRAIDESLAALRDRGDVPTLRGLIWLQGESDAGMKPDDYRAALATLFAALREDLRSAALPVAVGELLEINPQFRSLRGAQKAYADSDPRAVLVPSTDLTADHTFGGKLHLDTRSILLFGQRIAERLAPIVDVRPSP